jgi:5-formyltetrahydrofolate cyclo-ligase
VPAFRKAEHVAFYYGIAPEVETKTFLKKLLKEKKLYLPKVGPKKSLTLRRVHSLSKDLKKGAYNIMEPRAACEERPAGQMDIIITPGVAFDKEGGRLGRGGGYYDRLLRKAGRVIKIGLCFREQIVKKVPVNARDVRVDKIITD